jgi:lipopolysaccharide export system permease protein
VIRGLRVLDRYVTTEFLKIFAITALGFPVLTILIDLTDHVDRYLEKHLPAPRVALAYLAGAPEQVFFITPAAVLFATVFSVGALARHSEITAAKASGISFHRLVRPIFVLAAAASILAFFLGEFAPLGQEKRATLLGERDVRSQTARNNFVYRADGGRMYTIRSLSVPDRVMTGIQIEREAAVGGQGADSFPGYYLVAQTAAFAPRTGWTLRFGSLRLFYGRDREIAFSFDSLRQRAMTERPLDLLVEPKAPDQMRYAELGHYVQTVDRAGGDANKLKVERALKLAIPCTCLIITLFGAPLGIAGGRSGAAYGVAVSLATTIVFLTMVQIMKAVGAGGVVPPLLAAWIPNVLFGVAGVALFAKART